MTDQTFTFFDELKGTLTHIEALRKERLDVLVDYIYERQRSNEATHLMFVCTHNARRSHIAQLLAAAAAQYADLENMEFFSGGTEVTRIHPNAMAALEHIGFVFNGDDEGENPEFLVDLGDAQLIEVFSKKVDHDLNPQKDFAAVMVCAIAEENCPFIPETIRIPISYEDPKRFDGSEDALNGYLASCKEIGAEMLYVMQSVSQRLGQ